MSSSRRSAKAALRADRSGSGPTTDERPPARFPGASAAFALFGEVLVIGLLVTLVSIPLVTIPVALAAGIRHMRRFVVAEHSPMSAFWGDVKRGVLPGALFGLAALGATVVLLVDIDLSRSGLLPGGVMIAVVGWVGLAVVAVAVFVAAAAWTPALGWRAAVRTVPATVRADIVGALYLVATAAFVVVVTWMLPPLIIAGLGCATLAAVAIPARKRRG